MYRQCYTLHAAKEWEDIHEISFSKLYIKKLKKVFLRKELKVTSNIKCIDSITHYVQQKDGGIEHNEVMGLTKLHVVVYLMFLPLTTQCQLCVCGDTSWWRGQALTLGHSYSNLPCTNTDGAQQFSTRWGYGSVAGVGESESGFSSVEASTCLVKNGANDHAECYHTGQLSIMHIPWKIGCFTVLW